VKDNVIFPQKVDQLGGWVFPEGLPILLMELAPFFGSTDVANRSVKPNVEYFVPALLEGNRDTPV
jgi:hypothetical protein